MRFYEIPGGQAISRASTRFTLLSEGTVVVAWNTFLAAVSNRVVLTVLKN